jgi:HlyD family secretion protein
LTIPQAGDQVNPNTTAFRIDDLSTLYIDVEISEVDINKVEIGQDVNISLDALHNKEYSGKVIEIGSIGSDQSGVVIFSVTIQIMNSDEDVLPGMTAEVDIVIDRNEISLLIPNQAIRKNVNGNLIVYVLEAEGKMKEVEINLGESSDIQSEVTNNDLQVGDKVILNPPTDEEDTPQFMGPFGSSRIQNSSAPNTPEMGGN